MFVKESHVPVLQCSFVLHSMHWFWTVSQAGVGGAQWASWMQATQIPFLTSQAGPSAESWQSLSEKHTGHALSSLKTLCAPRRPVKHAILHISKELC